VKEDDVQYETLLYEASDAIGILTLNRPERLNAMNGTMVEELESFWLDRMSDLDTRVIILTGAGDRAFCGGLDVKDTLPQMAEWGPEEVSAFQYRGTRLELLMRQVPQPIICAVHGAAAGTGFSFAMASDVRVITPEARFSAAFIHHGMSGADAGSSYFLPRLIGAGRAYEFLLTGDFMTADEAVQLGFVSRVVSHEDLLPTSIDIARNMASKSPLGLRMTKEAINQNLDAAGLEMALHMENRNQLACILANRLHSPE
jgi:enoyl-CoA hydratase/carnithine racemase